MSESTALLLYHIAFGVRIFLVFLSAMFAFVACVAFQGMIVSEEKEVQLSLLNTAIRNALFFAVCVSLAAMIPGKDWFLTLVGGAQ